MAFLRETNKIIAVLCHCWTRAVYAFYGVAVYFMGLLIILIANRWWDFYYIILIIFFIPFGITPPLLVGNTKLPTKMNYNYNLKVTSHF